MYYKEYATTICIGLTNYINVLVDIEIAKNSRKGLIKAYSKYDQINQCYTRQDKEINATRKKTEAKLSVI